MECTGDSHCPAERPTCEGARGRCAICMHPGGCTGGRQCFVVECRERPTTPDADGDSYSDATDNCPEHANYGQRDLDGDGEGDVCDGDVDGDSVPDESDNCPLRLNPGQEDQDGDGWGDTCEGAPTGDPPGYLCPTVEHQERTYADGFESGSFVGWAVPVGAASTDERGEVDTFVAPELTAESAHTGRYGARFDKVLFPAEQDRALTLHPCMPLGAGVDLSLWVRPAQTGHCCGQFGSAGLRLTFRQGTRERRLNYLWAHSTQPDTRDERFIRLGDPPFRWVPDQWQQLEVALHEELEEHFNIGDPANVLLLEVHIFSHFANGSPGGFDVDELGLRPAE